MSDFAWILLIFVGYVVLMRWVLPAFGVHT
jgi:hypothetical protein